MKTKISTAIAIATILFACTKPDPNLVSITGKIKNPMGASAGFIGKDTTYVTNINDDGTFEIIFSLDSSTYLDFNHGLENTAMYVWFVSHKVRTYSLNLPITGLVICKYHRINKLSVSFTKL